MGGGVPGARVTHPALLFQLLLLDLLVVGNDLPDAVDKAALVVGDEAHEDLLLGRVQEHEHAHLAGGDVRKQHAPRLGGGGQEVRDPSKLTRDCPVSGTGRHWTEVLKVALCPSVTSERPQHKARACECALGGLPQLVNLW